MDTENKKKAIQSAQVHLAQYQPVASTETLDRGGWLKYGLDNNYPLYLKQLAETSPVHGALVKGITKMIAGKGLTTTNALDEAVLKQMGADKVLKSAANDIELYGGFYLEKILTASRDKTYMVKHLPFEHCRLSVDQNDNVLGIWYSRDWSNIRKEKYKPTFIPIDGTTTEVEGNKVSEARTVVISFVEESTSTFYPIPSYKSCINYIELDRSISQYHVSNVKNGFFATHHLALFHGQPTPEEKPEILNGFKSQTGAENAGQMIITFHEQGETPPQFTTLQQADVDKQYDILKNTANEMIFVGHLVTTPLIFGIQQEGKGFSSNADEMREGLRLFNMNVIEPMQRELIYTLEKATGIKGIEIEQNVYFEQKKVEAPVQTFTEKKKTELSGPKMSDEDEDEWLTHLYERGEVIDLEEYELIEAVKVTDPDEEEELNANDGEKLYRAYARPNAKSEMDGGVYKIRYRYPIKASANSRRFCKAMTEASSAGVVYRYEDIVRMGDEGVNSAFAAKGESTYSIFLYKGGANCHHYWTRLVYRRKREKGKFLPNDGLNNDERISQNQANKAGFDFKDSKWWSKASTRPIDMPNNGYKNPRP